MLVARETLSDEPAESMGLSSGPATELRLFAARGQYESASFVVHALEALSAVRVEVGELRPVAAPVGGAGAAAGQAIPADQIDVRVVREVRTQVPGQAKTYRLEPFLIERRATFDVPAGRARQVWLTVHVPDLPPVNLPAGRQVTGGEIEDASARAGGKTGVLVVRLARGDIQ